MTEIDRRFDVDVLSVAQSSESLFVVGFRLLVDLLFVEEQVVGMVVLAAQDDVERVFWRAVEDLICNELLSLIN